MRKRWLASSIVVIGLGLLAVVGASCGRETETAKPKPKQQFSADLQRQMKEIADAEMKKNELPGIIVGVWQGDKEWVYAGGQADIATGRQMDAADIVRIASNTKTFTAVLILKLADEGKLSLDDTLDCWFPEIPNSSKITVRQVLNMTAGIYSFTEDEEFGAAFEKDPTAKWTTKQEIDIALKHDPYWAPGGGWHYSDTNYVLLGDIASKVTKMSLADAYRKYLTKPLGLKNTSLPAGPNMPGTYAHGYYKVGDELKDYTRVDPSVSMGGGAMVSNIYELKVWVQALAEGKLISKKSYKEQMIWVPMPGQEKLDGKYGLGVASFAGYIGHTGSIFGFNSVIFHQPEDDVTIVVIGNKAANDSSETIGTFVELVKLLTPNRIPQ